MKRNWACIGLTLSLCALACAQDTASTSTGDRVVVPARNPTRPRVVSCSLSMGSITVQTGTGKDVIVETGAPRRPAPPPPTGMRRIGIPLRGLEVTEEDNQITIHRSPNGSGDLVITVPVDTSLHLKNSAGPIHVDGVHGEVDVHSLSGNVRLTNISGTVTADSQNGNIRVTMDRVDSGKPLAFSSLNGLIDLTFPPDFKANLTVKAGHAPVYSDFDVLLGGTRALTEKNGSSDGKFRIRIDNTIQGTINGGGNDLTIRSFNGNVYLRKKK